MNKLTGAIASFQSDGPLSKVEVGVSEEVSLKAIVAENPTAASYLQKGNELQILFKETEVVICKEGCHNISIENTNAPLLSELSVETTEGKINVINGSDALKLPHLSENMSVFACIRMNDLMLFKP